MWNTLLFSIGILVALGVFKALLLRSKLPPGPPALPLLGNLLQILTSRTWLVFDQWTKKYGPIFYLNIAGQNTIVLGTHKAAADLLD
ncbi:hypothetical protein J3R30DRAFT_3301331 [Lentinula aciculospora]|uniref:Cytochrome P450 n=1 Tax=Lentinula aciculospora TaxID=153920 RepID=A0A9W8ZZ36_9AGAR|nr:hypothetical protein J3R30DRAFT_3301331 [Lentinula aciculospora]